MLRLTPWSCIQKEELLRYLFQPGLHNTSNLSLTLPRCRKSLDFLEENAPSSSQCPDSLMQWAWSEEQGHPWEGEPGRHKLKHQIWTRGCDKCDPKHCFTSASHPFFFHWLLLTAALIRNSQEMLFKNIYTLKKALVFFPLCFLSHNVHALKDYHQNSQSLPSNSN